MRFAYGNSSQIQEAILAGKIPVETLIITSDEVNASELFFLDKEKKLKRVERKNKFLSLSDAKAWAPHWGIEGDVVSVKGADGKWKLGIVNSNKEIVMQDSSGSWGSYSFGDSGSIIPGDTSADFPAVGERGKIYVSNSDQSLYLWDETTSSYVMVGCNYNNLIYYGGDAYGD